MFSNLIESGSHRADLKRRGKFFLGATGLYALLLAATGVGSIYAYNARIDDNTADLEVLAVMRFSPVEARPERREEPRPAAPNNREQQYATRIDEISVVTPLHGDRVASEGAKDVGARTPVRIGAVNSDPAITSGGPAGSDYVGGPGGDGHGKDTGPAVSDTTAPPPPVAPRPAPPPHTGPVHLTSIVLTGKAISKPAPPYPAIAKAAGVQGSVAVQVLIDEQGRVLNAKATSGHPLLQSAAVQAAYKATFTPTVLTGSPVKVTGVITYNFVLNR
jgi:periplasmic protein TonB